jgi:hypothetical protein
VRPVIVCAVRPASGKGGAATLIGNGGNGGNSGDGIDPGTPGAGGSGGLLFGQDGANGH